VESVNTLRLGRDTLGTFEAGLAREWLVTNGLGGYAAGTVAGVNTRRYHGLLVAAQRPPVGRTVLVAQVDCAVTYRGRRVELGTNEFAGGYLHPDGWRRLVEFRLEGTLPVWRWVIGDVVLERRVWMPHGANTTYAQYSVLQSGAPVDFEFAPLCTDRDYHWHHRGGGDYRVEVIDRGLHVRSREHGPAYRILAERGRAVVDPSWYWNFRHRTEAERGLDDAEDLFRPGFLHLSLAAGESAALVLTAESADPAASADALVAERARQDGLLSAAFADWPATPARPQWIEQLTLAADQFVVERHDATQALLGHTVIAGYPWFADWGRDTMIALPGLTLATGRPEFAASILRTFARFVSEGMLPNRFPDAGEAPEYNTVDATLWFFVAIGACWRRTRDRTLLEDLYPTLRDIVAAHRRGTRYDIGVDPADGLLRAGIDGVQLTWMDAKVGDWVVTPRIGKPVEINALWFNALCIMRDFAQELGRDDDASAFLTDAERVGRSFNDAFWHADRGYLYDVVDGPDGERGADGRTRDASLRPNQIFAMSLPHPLLDNGRARSVVDACLRELWTPVGLRSLASSDPRYAGRYTGGPVERDGVYHQGTVWSWLAGPLALAHHRAYGDAARARRLLEGLGDHLHEAGLGQISEIFDGDAPHAPRGCFAQAWSVAETLRAWRELDEYEAEERRRGAPRRHARKVAP
jgi:predicted glycogen debranching enzyme